MKILFVHNYPATFTKIDLDILREVHDVREMYVRRTGLAQLLRDHARLVADVQWADLVFAWFGGYHALLPFLLARARGRKCVVVASGYDVAAMPESDYGNMRPGLRRWIGRRVFALADRVLAVSAFTRGEAIANVGVPPAKIQVIYHGLDAQHLHPGQPEMRRSQVLTVASVMSGTLRIKGLPDYVAAAATLPSVPFLIVGPQEAETAAALRRAATANVQLLGPVYGDELVKIMQQSTIYAQLSAYESFGMAVAESMLCGCVPVASDRGALPEVVGAGGLVVPYGDAKAAAQAIATGLALPPAAGLAARQRIVSAFPLERRRQALLAAVDEVVSSAPVPLQKVRM